MTDIKAKFMTEYHNLDDGLVLSFGFFYPASGNLSVQGLFYAKNHLASSERWDTIKIIVEDVVDLKILWKGNQAHSICTGVHLVKIDDLWCLDVDGIYGDVEAPKSIAEIQNFGDCYAIGKQLNIYIIPDCRTDLNNLTPGQYSLYL